jgi:hypothetical protein
MKKIIPHLIILGLLISRQAFSQQTGATLHVSGRVMDVQNKPVPYATVTLIKATDSSLVKGAITDEAGNYSFSPATSGKYRVSASVIGMVKAFSKPFDLSAAHPTVSLSGLVLRQTNNQLKEVSVTASKPFIQHEIDKTVVNVENSIVSAGNSAWEILQKSPGITVDNSNNTIRLQGKTGVVIYIDGKPSHLSQEQLANMLKNLNASSIQSIEIMTQPSSKYDAAGNAGIINIVTRKSKEAGFSGSATAGFTQGKYSRENGGLDLNYREGKLNLYGNYNYTHAKWWNDNYITRNFYDGTGKTYSTRTEQYGYHTTPANSHNFKAGADYYLDDKNTIGFMMSGNINTSKGNRNNTTWFKNPDASLQSTSLTHNTSNGDWTNYTYDLNYQGRFDSSGRELDVDAAYSRFDNTSLQHYRTDTYYPDGSPFPDTETAPNPNIRKGSLPSLIEIRTAKMDYTLPLKHQTKVEFGAKYSLVTSDNNVQYNKLDNQTQQWAFDSATNHFKYTENINAAYVNFNRQFKKGWGLQLGLRGEQTISKGHQFTNDSTVKRNYFQLFPSAFLSKKINKNNTLNFSYSRRIDRPDYQSLNPFRYYLDPYTYEEGNPFLQPQLTNSIKFSYSYKSLLTAAVSYSNTSDVMSQVLKQDDSAKITYQTDENLSRMQNIGLDITLSIPVTNWWMSNNFINAFYNKYQGEFLGGELNFGQAAYTFNSTNTFTLPQGFTAELSGFYNSAMQWSIFSIRPQYAVSFGIGKTFLDKKASLKLNVNDVFDTQHSFASVRYQNLDVTSLNHWDSRRVSLTFTYHFNKGNVKPVHHHQSAIEEEQNRIKK